MGAVVSAAVNQIAHETAEHGISESYNAPKRTNAFIMVTHKLSGLKRRRILNGMRKVAREFKLNAVYRIDKKKCIVGEHETIPENLIGGDDIRQQLDALYEAVGVYEVSETYGNTLESVYYDSEEAFLKELFDDDLAKVTYAMSYCRLLRDEDFAAIAKLSEDFHGTGPDAEPDEDFGGCLLHASMNFPLK